MSGNYNPWLVGLGVVVAMAAYEALRAVSRLADRRRTLQLALTAGAALAGALSCVGALAFPALPRMPMSVLRATISTLGVSIAISALVRLLGLLYPLKRRSRHDEALEQAQARLQHFATHDALTDLPNRLLLADRLEQAIAHADRNGTRFALLLIDLDHFKAVNDSLGHAAGDELLAEVARRLTATVRRSDTLARFGGDEFVLIVNGVAAAEEIEGLIGKVCECLTRPIDLTDLEVHVSLSVGVSIYPNDGADRETLLKHADVAMYQAKRAGRNGYQFYAPAMNAFTRERLVLENDLRRAVRASEFQLLYQPQVSTVDGRIESAEALIRWNHPRRGLLPAAAFISLAEESGLIIPIGQWVLREACRQAKQWRLNGVPLRVAVNLSAEQLRQKELPEMVRAALAASGMDPADLELELTETVVMQDAEVSVRTLRRVSDLGVSIAVDDFGTGYSSLSYLRRLPLRRLKIDRSFVRDILTCRETAEIVRAIVSLAASLDLQVTAEGVETREQLEALRRLGCEHFQGFFCSAPVAAAQLPGQIAEWQQAHRRLGARRGPHAAGPGDDAGAAQDLLGISGTRP
ncbi:MAG TPA: EAL domain-containing protein [Steroidobacteraceae bacterium]|jgi:diguanylate cyclase (GGDEF)-like protein|nr:EAL domain-containing protein [Steroidobacteraceae bacterium]